MKKIFILTAIAVLLGVASASAQRIAVVNEEGTTTLFQNLPDAIKGADPGSVIYLPGGGFPLPDSVKITKRMTIIGIGHKSTNDNVDGYTTIGGNVFFNEGSGGSAIMSCLISGTVCIGHDGGSVNNILVKCCNVNNIDSRANCENIVISQNYIRNMSYIRGCGCMVNNNILGGVSFMNSSTFCYNILIYLTNWYPIIDCRNSYFYNNIVWTPCNYIAADCQNIQVNRNMSITHVWGDNCVTLTDCTWDDVFVNYNGGAISPMSDFHFKEAYQQYSDIGIYGGTGFNDHQTAPVPYIVAKRIAEETDAAGQLKIQVRVKSGE